MTAIPFPCVAPVDDEASERRRRLRQRMRIVTVVALSSLASLAGIVVYAYVASDALTAFGLLFVGVLTLLEAFRQADRRFIAPLQARCQDDYNRQIETLLGPLFETRVQPRLERADRVDA